MMKYLRLIASVLCIFVAVSPAVAQIVSSKSPDSIVEALQRLGYRAQLEKDSLGDPRIRSAVEGVNYSFWFYGCIDNKDCDLVVLQAGFDMSGGGDLEAINDWNRRKIVGRAYLDSDNDPMIDHVVVMDEGITEAAFGEIVRRWGLAVADFKKVIGW